MFLPFVLATSFVTIACANTLHTRGIQVRGAVDAAHALEPLIGLTLGRVVFSLGVLSMCFTTMVLEMLLCGFVLSEMLGFELHGRAYKASTMLANIGVLGAFAALPFWVPVATPQHEKLSGRRCCPGAQGSSVERHSRSGYRGRGRRSGGQNIVPFLMAKGLAEKFQQARNVDFVLTPVHG
jgi:hypothetical protein